MSDVKVDFSAVLAAVADLDARRSSVMSNVTPIVAEILLAAIDHQFETEGEGKWPQLAESTLRGRRESTNPMILQDTGIFAASWQPFTSAAVAEAFTEVPYAKYHIGDAPRTIIPKRDPTEVDMDDILSQAADEILDAMVR